MSVNSTHSRAHLQFSPVQLYRWLGRSGGEKVKWSKDARFKLCPFDRSFVIIVKSNRADRVVPVKGHRRIVSLNLTHGVVCTFTDRSRPDGWIMMHSSSHLRAAWHGGVGRDGHVWPWPRPRGGCIQCGIGGNNGRGLSQFFNNFSNIAWGIPLEVPLLFHSPFKGRIPMILDRVIRSTFKQPRNLGPFVSNFFSGFVNDPVLVHGPVALFNIWI